MHSRLVKGSREGALAASEGFDELGADDLVLICLLVLAATKILVSRTPVACWISAVRTSPSRPNAITCCFLSSLKTLAILTKANKAARQSEPPGSSCI